MLIQILLNSILSALLLSMVAIGFNLIFNATKVFHLAHGAMYVCAVYAYYEFNNYFQNILSQNISIVLSIILSLLLISFLIVLTEILVYRPLSRRNMNSAISLISSLGVYLFLVNLITLFLGNENISLHSNFKIAVSTNYFKLTNMEVMQLCIFSFLIFVVFLLSKTKYYKQIRAISDDYSISKKFGINVQKARITALIAGTLLVGVAGIMKGYEIAIDPYVGLSITLTASVAVIVGGLTSLTGTVLACFVLAIVQNFSVKFISDQWKDMLTYTLLLIVLVFYQQGLISVKQRIETR